MSGLVIGNPADAAQVRIGTLGSVTVLQNPFRKRRQPAPGRGQPEGA
jgi:hypothetical protein